MNVARKARNLTLSFPVGLFLFSFFQPHDINGSVKVPHSENGLTTSKGKWFDPSTSLPVLCNYSSLDVEVLLVYSCQNHRGGTSSSFTRGAGKSGSVGICLAGMCFCVEFLKRVQQHLCLSLTVRLCCSFDLYWGTDRGLLSLSLPSGHMFS